ncbi:hypothetical protein ACMGDH_01630 [Sphingomonas sp. DT-207]
MNIRPDPKAGRWPVGRWIAAGVAAGLLLLVTVVYVRTSSNIAAVASSRVTPQDSPQLHALAPVARAIIARPLRQELVNFAVVYGGHVSDERWILLLRRLGWRSTEALQTILAHDITKNNLAGALDSLDALLRRRQLFDEGSLALGQMEKLDEGRPYVVRLLARRPPWRRDYLLMAGDLRDPRAALSRYQVLLALRRGGDQLERHEVAPLLPALIRGGNRAEAWHLWQLFDAARVTSPVNDPDFRVITSSLDGDIMSVPFEWHIATGPGFSAVPYLDAGVPRLSLSWDGRGVPVFASQRTSAQPGMYRLNVTTQDSHAIVDRLLAFRLRCDDGSVVDFRLESPSGSPALRYLSEARVPCAFPELQIAARLQASPSSYNVSLDRITLSRLPDAG